MITIMPESEGSIIGVEFYEPVTDTDYRKVFIPEMERVLAEHGKCRLLIYIPEHFAYMTMGALWDDIKFSRAHKEEIERMCLVGEGDMFEWSLKIYAEQATDHALNFSHEQLDEAWEWIRA